MTESYDVAIAGAGPAGGQCARDVAARGFDVVVLETESESEFPAQSNKSTAGTFPSTMAAFGVPNEVVMNDTDAVVLESPNNFMRREQTGYVLEFADFKRWLVADSRDRGAEYRFDARVNAPITENGEVVGIRYNGDQAVYADIVIDATGPSAPLAKKLDVCDLRRDRQAIGIEYEMRGVRPNVDGFADLRDTMMLRLDHDTAPGGYAWLFHTGDDTAKVGLCYIQNDVHTSRAVEGKTIDGYLQEWIDTDPRLTAAERIEGKQHRGSGHIQLPERLHTDRFMAIGDTVPTIDPLWGEGIGKCMRSGRAAAVAVDHALGHGSWTPDAETLSVYEDLWHEDVAPNVENRLLMTELLYRASNARYDQLMSDLDDLGQETLARANAGSKRAIAKLLKLRDLPTLAGFAWERISGQYTGM
ncbi:MAG: digeranylgeranylglycerophospholipid reductase [Salinirussus sp.]